MSDVNERYSGEAPISEEPKKALSLIIADNSVSTPKLQNLAVTTEKLDNGAVTPDKLSDSVVPEVIQPVVEEASTTLSGKIDRLEQKHNQDINALRQETNNSINTLSNRESRDIASLRTELSRSINDLGIKESEDIQAVYQALSNGIEIVSKTHSQDMRIIQSQFTDFTRQYNRNRTADQKGLKEQLRALKDRDKDLQGQIDALQIGGWAISQMFGNDTHIGISQNTLTNLFGRLWEVIGEIKGKDYMDFTLTVNPAYTYREGDVPVTITADCTDTVSYFDSIKLYVDDVLVDEATNINLLTTVATISQTSSVKAVGVIVGKTIEKELSVIKELPTFMGSAPANGTYLDVMVSANWKEIEGTLEGAYDITVNHDGDNIYIILPISMKDEFRRIVTRNGVDMNGFEFPLELTETVDLVIAKSVNTYRAGTYNIDININS